MRTLKAILFGLFLMNVFVGAHLAVATPLQATQLKFRYLTYDGELNFPCVATVTNADASDWFINCQSADYKTLRNYTVHLSLTEYHRPEAPKLAYELLYWITEESVNGSTDGHSSSVWFYLNEVNPMSLLEFRQGVEKDTAYLELSIGLDSKKIKHP